MMRGRVYTILGNGVEVHAPEGTFRCGFRGKAKRERGSEMKLCAVGDDVEFTGTGSGEGVIERVLPRRSKLSRVDPSNPNREFVIVANLDALLVVVAAKSPDLDLLTIDKCLVLGAAGLVQCAVVVNKMDVAPAGTSDRLEPYRRMGLTVLPTSASKGEGIEALRDFVKGRMVSMVGPSGVGKSSLVNALAPGLNVRTGLVSEVWKKGKHTTTWATIFDLPGGRLVDTPGLEFFTAWGVTPTNLKEHFVEFAEASAECKFRDCQHVSEPKCAVLARVKSGRVAASRHANYVAIRSLLLERRDWWEAHN